MLILAKQLIASKLNNLNGSVPAPASAISGGDLAIGNLMFSFDINGNYTGAFVASNSSLGMQMTGFGTQLDDFIQANHCQSSVRRHEMLRLHMLCSTWRCSFSN